MVSGWRQPRGDGQPDTAISPDGEGKSDGIWRMEALSELSRAAMRSPDVQILLTAAAQLIAATLGNEYAKVLELLPDRKALRLRAGVGWREGLAGTATVDAGLDSQAGYTLLADRPVVVADLRTEPRFRGPPLLVEHGIVSGISAIIPGRGRPWGILGTHSTRPRRFGEDDIQFVQAVATLLGLAIERTQAEEERFHVLVESVKDYALLTLDPQGRVSSWNAGAERNTGYREAEILGQHVSVFYPADDVARDAPTEELRQAVAEGRVEVEGWRVRKDGSRFWAGVVMTARYDPDGRLSGFVRVTRDLTERKYAQEALRATQADLARRLADFTRLYALADRLSSTTSLKTAVDEVLVAVTALLETTSGVLMVDDPTTGELYLLASVGVPQACLDRLRRVPQGTGIGGMAVVERQPVIVEDLARESDTAPDRSALELGGYHAACAVPLLAPRDEVLGVLTIFFPEPHRPTERELSLVRLYAHLAAGFLANARLAQDTQDVARSRDGFLWAIGDDLRQLLAMNRDHARQSRAEIGAAAEAIGDTLANADDLAPIEALLARLAQRIADLVDGDREHANGSPLADVRPTDAADNQSNDVEQTPGPRGGGHRDIPGSSSRPAARREIVPPRSWPEDERARFLRTVPAFRALPPDALCFAASVAQPRQVEAGQFIVLEGEPLETLKVVAEGRIKLLREIPGGREVILRIVGPGEVFGLVALGTRLTHRASAVAQVDGTYLAISRDEFFSLLTAHPAFARSIIRLMGQGLYEAETRICTLQAVNAERRIAWTLLKLASPTRRDKQSVARIDLPLSRADLARLAGTNVSTASRTLSAWSCQGIVVGGRKHVVILDERALRAFAEGKTTR